MYITTDMHIGQRLRQARAISGKSQKEVCELLNISQQRYSKWELGRSEPDTEMIARICQIMGITPNWLLGDGIQFDHTIRRGCPMLQWNELSTITDNATLNYLVEESTAPRVKTGCTDKHSFALKINNDSMAPDFKEGDIIIVSPKAAIDSGDFIICKYDDTILFRQLLKYGNLVVLRAFNTSYPEITAKIKANLIIYGRVVERITRF